MVNVLLLTLLLWCGGVVGESPNIVLIFIDDMAWGDLGANMPHETSYTPTLDKLAAQGIRLTDFHVGAPICTPSRAALLTGRIGLRTGVTRLFGLTSLEGLPNNETTIAEYMKTVNYSTAMTGKWHLGLQNGHNPVDRGFDYWFGLATSNDGACKNAPTGYNHPEEVPCLAPGASGTAMPLFENKDVISQPLNLWNLHDYYAEKATHFIRRSVIEKKPFFLYVPLTHMHVPHAYAERFNVTTSHYKNSLLEMDSVVESIVKELQQDEIYDNTLIWLISDNGPWEQKCELAGDNGPFTGEYEKQTTGGSSGKMTVWEGGHRSPAFITWPKVIKEGSVCDSLLSATDVLPTLSTLVGFELKEDRMLDGLDITSLIQNGCQQMRESLLIPTGYGGDGGLDPANGKIGCVRYGNLSAIIYSGGTQGCNQTSRPAITYHDPPLIFDLSTDPGQSQPIAANATLLAHIQKLLEEYYVSVEEDNTSTADYSHDKSAEPCCNYSALDHDKCYCPWSL